MSAPNRKIIKMHEFVAHSMEVRCLALGPKMARVMVTGCLDASVNVWIVGRPNIQMSLSGHSSSVETVKFRADEQTVAAGSASGTLKIWDLEHASIIRTLAGHKADMILASGSMDTRIRVWDVRKKGCIFSYKGHSDKVNCVLFSPDGKWLASAGEDCAIKIWELSSGKLIHDFKEHTGPVTSLEYHPREFLLASGSKDRTTKFWDLEKFSLVDQTAQEATGIRKMAFHQNGEFLFTGSHDALRIHSWEPWTCYETIPVQWNKLSDMCYVSEQIIAASYNQSVVTVWTGDMPTGNFSRIEKCEEPQSIVSDIAKQGYKPLSASQRKNFEKYNMAKSPTENLPTRTQNSDSEHEEIQPNFPEACDNIFIPGDQFKHVKNNQVKRFSSNDRQIKAKNSQDDLNKPRIIQPKHIAMESNPECKSPIEEFQVPKAASKQKLQAQENDETVILNRLSQEHHKVQNILTSRLNSHRQIRQYWNLQEPITSLKEAIKLGQQDVLVDIINVINLKSSLWTLSMCHLILPELKYILQAKYNSYIILAANTIKILLQSFGSLIKVNIEQPSTVVGVDISREERHQKCHDCYGQLIELKEILYSKLQENRDANIIKSLEELKRCFDVFE